MDNKQKKELAEYKRLDKVFETRIDSYERAEKKLLKIDIKKGLDSTSALRMQRRLDDFDARLRGICSRARACQETIKLKKKALEILNYNVGNSDVSNTYAMQNYDLNFDGKITAEDALEALKQANDIY